MSVHPVISRGVYDIFVEKDGVSVCVGKYDNKGSFGELALMYNTPRAATIVATVEGALWALVSGGDDDASLELQLPRESICIYIYVCVDVLILDM